MRTACRRPNLQEFLAYAKANMDKVGYAGAGAGHDATSRRADSRAARASGSWSCRVAASSGRSRPSSCGDVQVTSSRWARTSSWCARACCGCWRRRPPSACPMCRTCRRSPSRASRASRLRPGSRCLRRAARRRTPRAAQRLHPRRPGRAGDRRRLAATFVDPLPLTQSEFAAQVKADAVKWERIVTRIRRQARLNYLSMRPSLCRSHWTDWTFFISSASMCGKIVLAKARRTS